ncbi:hypothetical protein LXL04_023530 [Taraxacum kok-saghyz]
MEVRRWNRRKSEVDEFEKLTRASFTSEMEPSQNRHPMSRASFTNLDEFGMGSTTEGSTYQVTANPWDLECVARGSCGGQAAAVSARQCAVSLGSDTGSKREVIDFTSQFYPKDYFESQPLKGLRVRVIR